VSEVILCVNLVFELTPKFARVTQIDCVLLRFNGHRKNVNTYRLDTQITTSTVALGAGGGSAQCVALVS